MDNIKYYTLKKFCAFLRVDINDQKLRKKTNGQLPLKEFVQTLK